MEEAVIVLNADYSPLNIVRFRRAIKLVLNKKAVIVEAGKRFICNAEQTIKMLIPKVIRLIEYVVAIRRTHVAYSRKSVIIRDGCVCAYCGSKEKLTVDHIIPKTRGGKSEFTNCVAACYTCNNKKGSRTPEEAGMKLRIKPYHPSLADFVDIRMRTAGVYEKIDYGKMGATA